MLNANENIIRHQLTPEDSSSINSYSKDNVSLKRGILKKKEKVKNIKIKIMYKNYSD